VFELLAAVLLSAQATDTSVNKATRELFALAPTPQKMLALGEARVTELIRTIGLFRTKAKNLLATCRILVDQHGGQVPRTREALQALPGVGPQDRQRGAQRGLRRADDGGGHPRLSRQQPHRPGAGTQPAGSGGRAAAARAGPLPGRCPPLADPAWPLCLPRARPALQGLRRAFLLRRRRKLGEGLPTMPPGETGDMAKLDDLSERVDRLVLRHQELKRTSALIEQQLMAVTAERDSLRSRLAAARARIDALLNACLPTHPRRLGIMKQVEVSILGQVYMLGCPEGGEALLATAVAAVDKEMTAIRDAGKVKARERIAVLAALNLAYQLAERGGAAPPAARCSRRRHRRHRAAHRRRLGRRRPVAVISVPPRRVGTSRMNCPSCVCEPSCP
jgi:cell division protein ZapA (FtsZ GTPase activity inhibitor)